jgi:ribosomal protein S6
MLETDNQKLYELAYFLSPELNESEILACAQTIKKFVLDAGGNITAEIPAQKKKIGQPIKNQAFGYFGLFFFQGNPDSIDELKKNLKLETKIIRHMIAVKKPASLKKKKKKESAGRFPFPIFKTAEKHKREAAAAVPPGEKTEKLEPEKEKAQIEELNKKLEEILSE